MNQDQVIVCCDKNTSLDTREEDKKECPPKKIDVCSKRVEREPEPKRAECDPCGRFKSEPKKVECGQPRTAKLSGCCAKPCGVEKPTKPRGVTSTGCEDEPVSTRIFVQEKKQIKCECIKFNGLQDSCIHPSCCSRGGCFGVPFPTCPPAQKWKDEFICKINRNNNGC